MWVSLSPWTARSPGAALSPFLILLSEASSAISIANSNR